MEVTSPTTLPKTDIREQFAEHFNRSQDKLSKFNEVFLKLGSDPTGLDEMEEGGLCLFFLVLCRIILQTTIKGKPRGKYYQAM